MGYKKIYMRTLSAFFSILLLPFNIYAETNCHCLETKDSSNVDTNIKNKPEDDFGFTLLKFERFEILQNFEMYEYIIETFSRLKKLNNEISKTLIEKIQSVNSNAIFNKNTKSLKNTFEKVTEKLNEVKQAFKNGDGKLSARKTEWVYRKYVKQMKFFEDFLKGNEEQVLKKFYGKSLSSDNSKTKKEAEMKVSVYMTHQGKKCIREYANNFLRRDRNDWLKEQFNDNQIEKNLISLEEAKNVYRKLLEIYEELKLCLNELNSI